VNEDKRRHDLGIPYAVVDNCIRINGIPLTRLAEQAGSAPFYVYDRSALTLRVQELRTALPEQIHIHYAIKANPMPALVAHMAGLVDGMDVASVGELRVTLDAGIDPALVSFAGPGKDRDELRAAVAAGIVVSIESPTEMAHLADIAQTTGCRPRVVIRVNPDFELKASGMKMGGGPKPFGIDAETVPEILAQLSTLSLEFMGFHIFSGSQNLQAEAICEAQTKTVALALRLAEHAPAPVQLLNIGGGLGIPYFPGDPHLDVDVVGRHLAGLLPQVQEKLPQAQIILELGRYLVAEAGTYVSRIIDRKLSRGQTFLVTNGGLHQHLAASGNFGQVIRKNYPVIIGNRVHSEEREIVNIVGRLCTPLDILGDKISLPRAEIGDLVAILQSGAYGPSASPARFLGHPAALEMLV
jgi:diaminopimelate decarboxylase